MTGIQGIVRDSSGSVIPGATVRVMDANGRSVGQMVTSQNGEYGFDVAPGSYRVVITLQGFRPVDRTVTVRPGAGERLDAVMSVAGVTENITIDAATSARGRGGRGGVPGGVVGGVVGGLPSAPPPPPPPPPAAEPAALMERMEAAASAQELGDLFEYRLDQPVTIRKDQSALVPILNAPVTADRVSLWRGAPGSGRPLRAVWLTNATGLTLDGGTFSVVDANAFAGEGLIDPLKPGEKRLLSYGADLAVVVDARQDDSSGRVTRVTAHDGIIVAYQEERARWIYRIRNEDTTPRTMVVEHPVRRGWSVGEEPRPVEQTASSARYTVPVESKKEATLTVTDRRAGETRYSIGDVDERLIVSFAERGVPAEALRTALQPVLEQRRVLSALDTRLTGLNEELSGIARDQERLRENMKALRGSSEEKALLQRYTRELNAQEDRLAELKAQLQKMSAERDAARAELSRRIQQLTFEIPGRRP
jgi:hypothetical protein